MIDYNEWNYEQVRHNKVSKIMIWKQFEHGVMCAYCLYS